MSEFTATPTQRYSRTCPLCNSPTSSLHSHYTRHPTDLPISEHAIRLTLNVRRFRCRNTTCQRRIFNERLPEVIAAQARKTIRLREWIAQVGLELGGEAGFRILNSNAVQTSADTILRTVLSLPMSKVEVPKAIGIDEFFLALHQHLTGLGRAFKRGHTYGTVIVNLETGKPIDLLPDREVATVTRWLEEHPGAQFVARDRSTGFAEAISKGAPEAQQVLDRFLLTRWHLLDPKAAPGGPGSLAGR